MCTFNDGVRSLLFHASMPSRFWAEALSTATYLMNCKPCHSSSLRMPHELLLSVASDYSLLRVFGCLCFPNTTSTSRHKLDHRSIQCVFLGYPPDHRRYRCYDLASHHVITSRHVRFDESSFSFAARPATNPTAPPAPRFVPAPVQVSSSCGGASAAPSVAPAPAPPAVPRCTSSRGALGAPLLGSSGGVGSPSGSTVPSPSRANDPSSTPAARSPSDGYGMFPSSARSGD